MDIFGNLTIFGALCQTLVYISYLSIIEPCQVRECFFSLFLDEEMEARKNDGTCMNHVNGT